MSYATIDDVKTLFRELRTTGNAAVTDANINLFLTNSKSVIDGKLQRLYVLPITELDNPASFAVLKQIHMMKVADIVDNILNSYGEADKKPEWGMKAKALLKEICPPVDPKTGKQPPPSFRLPDAEYLGTPEQKNRISLGTQGGQIFKKGDDNW